jgi:hypothetical protein
MFCPDCGTENARGQKFCTRCGNNLMALEHARTIVNEVAVTPSSPIEPRAVLRIVSLVAIFGLFFITGGTIALLGIEASTERGIHTPIPIFFGLGGLFTVFMICRYLVSLINAAPKPTMQFTRAPQAQPPLKPTTNRSLAEGTPYFSVTEQSTQQFDPQRRPNS